MKTCQLLIRLIFMVLPMIHVIDTWIHVIIGSIKISAKSTLIGTAVYVVQFTDPDSPDLSTSSSCSPLPCPFSVGLGRYMFYVLLLLLFPNCEVKEKNMPY